MSTQSPAASAAESELVISRFFDAPRETVFKAWTDEKYLLRWWAPRGFTTPYCKTDLRVGGLFHFCMRTADGTDIWGRGVYREIVRPEHLVYVDSFADPAGQAAPPERYGMGPTMPAETLVTLTFAEKQGGTALTLRHSSFADAELREQCRQGWEEMLDRLEQELAKD